MLAPPPDTAAITAALLAVTRHVIEAEAAGTPAAPAAPLPDFYAAPWLVRLLDQARLDAVEVVVLRVLLAAELEPTAYRALQRLAGDPTQPGVAVDALVVALRAFGHDPTHVLHALRPEGPLRGKGLVELHGDRATPPLACRLTVPQRLVHLVLTGEPPPPLGAPLLLVEPATDVGALCPVPLRDAREPAPAAEVLRRALPHVLDGEPVWLTGPAGSGRRTLLAGLAAELGKRVLVLRGDDARALAAADLPATLWRELLLHDALLCVADADAPVAVAPEGGDAPTATRAGDALAALYGRLRRAGLPVVFCSDQPPATQDLERAPQVLRLGAPAPADTLALWRAQLPESASLEEIATRFKLTPGRVVRAARAARQVARGYGRAEVTPADIAQAVSVSVAQQVAVLGTIVEDSQTWDDIVLPDDTRASVKELIARVRFRHTVLDQWGFRRKMSKGLGVAALFSGPPGTGKTMIASLIARELGQELYQIDLSRVVSKWIGETEKNLARVFDAAEGANVLLLFDEADSLFAKRTEVKSSNDRHANAEVNYLLQRVERFEGVCILTTNFEGSIDPAFKRRLAFRMIFPFPDEAERAELWRRMMPPGVALAADVDFDELGRAYELAGGNIRNAVLRAAFLAAAEQRPLDRDLLLRAVRLEYRDAGKFTTAGRLA